MLNSLVFQSTSSPHIIGFSHVSFQWFPDFISTSTVFHLILSCFIHQYINQWIHQRHYFILSYWSIYALKCPITSYNWIPKAKYNNKEQQPVSWLILIVFKGDLFQQGSFLLKFLCLQKSNQFKVLLFPRSKYNNKEQQLDSWLILIVFNEAFSKKGVLWLKTQYCILSYWSIYALKCPITSMCLGFPDLNRATKSSS